MWAHKRWKRSLIKSRILEAAVKNDQGMTSITGLLSHHRRQLHLNWTGNSLELPEVDTLGVLRLHSDWKMSGGWKKQGRLHKNKQSKKKTEGKEISCCWPSWMNRWGLLQGIFAKVEQFFIFFNVHFNMKMKQNGPPQQLLGVPHLTLSTSNDRLRPTTSLHICSKTTEN